MPICNSIPQIPARTTDKVLIQHDPMQVHPSRPICGAIALNQQGAMLHYHGHVAACGGRTWLYGGRTWPPPLQPFPNSQHGYAELNTRGCQSDIPLQGAMHNNMARLLHSCVHACQCARRALAVRPAVWKLSEAGACEHMMFCLFESPMNQQAHACGSLPSMLVACVSQRQS